MDTDGTSLPRAGGCACALRSADWFITRHLCSLHSAPRGQIVNGPTDLRHIVFRYQSCKFGGWMAMDEVAVRLHTAGGWSHQEPIIGDDVETEVWRREKFWAKQGRLFSFRIFYTQGSRGFLPWVKVKIKVPMKLYPETLILPAIYIFFTK